MKSVSDILFESMISEPTMKELVDTLRTKVFRNPLMITNAYFRVIGMSMIALMMKSGSMPRNTIAAQGHRSRCSARMTPRGSCLNKERRLSMIRIWPT